MNQTVTRAATWAVGFAYAAAWGIAGWLWTGPRNDLDYFFVPAARIALSGHPFQVYTVRLNEIIANDNGPLGLVPLMPVAAVVSGLGWLDDERLRRMLILAAFSIFSLLLAREAVAAIDRLRGDCLDGLSRLLAYGINRLKIENAARMSMRRRRSSSAGIGFGLAILTRSLAALPLISLGLLLLARGRWRALAWLAGSATLVVALGLLPFVVADPQDTIYSLLTHRASLPVGGGSLWQLAVGTPYQWLPQRADVLFVLGLAVLLSMIVIVARKDLEPSSRDIYGLLALTALTLPLLAKSVWPYYFLDAYVFGAVWWLGQPSPLAWRRIVGATIPIMASVGTLLTEYEMPASAGRTRLWEGVAMGAALSVLTAALAIRLRRRSPA